MPRKVTVDDMVAAVREAGRPCTKQDIADRTGVTRQTIANYSHELEDDPRVECGMVGQATAYWMPDDPQPAQGEIRADGGYVNLDKINNHLTGHVAGTPVESAPLPWLKLNFGLILSFALLGLVLSLAGIQFARPDLILISAAAVAIAFLGIALQIALLFGYSATLETIGAFAEDFLGKVKP